MILLVSKDHSGKLVSAQLALNLSKNSVFADVNQVESLKEPSGKLVNAQLSLNPSKKPHPTDVILLVSKDHSGKLAIAQFLLKSEKNR